MRKAKGKKGLTTEVVVDSKGQPFDKHVQLREMHAGDAAIQVFTWLTGEITPSQRATLVREFGMMIAEHGKFLGDYPNPGTPYKPGTVIWWGSEKNLGIVEEFHENAIQVRRVNERGRAYTTVIDMIGTSEVEGRVGIEGLILETAVRNPLAISPAMAGLLKNPGAISELFLLKDVMTSVKGTILDKLSCTADEYLAVIRANKRSDRGFVTKLAQKAKDDRATVLVAIYSLQPDLLDGVTDQELLAAIVGLDMKSLTSKLGEYGHVREIEPLREKAGSLIHDQRIIEKLAETGPRDVREGAALLLDDPDCWILGSAEMDIAQVEAWAEKFSVWDTGLVNRLAQDTKLLYNHGMFRAFKLSGKLTQEAYKAIVEKYEAITPLNGISLWPFLREIEDREFVAGKIKKWADDPTRATTAPAIVKLVGQCGGEIKAAADAHQPLDPKIAFVLEQSAKLPDYLREVSERAVDLLRHAQAV